MNQTATCLRRLADSRRSKIGVAPPNRAHVDSGARRRAALSRQVSGTSMVVGGGSLSSSTFSALSLSSVPGSPSSAASTALRLATHSSPTCSVVTSLRRYIVVELNFYVNAIDLGSLRVPRQRLDPNELGGAPRCRRVGSQAEYTLVSPLALNGCGSQQRCCTCAATLTSG